MTHPPTAWPGRTTLALVRSLMHLVWGLDPGARPAPQALVERRRGPAA